MFYNIHFHLLSVIFLYCNISIYVRKSIRHRRFSRRTFGRDRRGHASVFPAIAAHADIKRDDITILELDVDPY